MNKALPMLRHYDYDNHLSGNGCKPRLLLAHLGQSCERVEVDILKGETRTPEFLTRNPNGRIPVLEIEDGACIIAVACHWIQHVEMTQAQRAQLPARQEGGRAALAVMESHLGGASWFGGDAMSIADIALYAYTHVADEGGFDLTDFPAVSSWLARVADQPGHVPMNPAAPAAPRLA